MFTRRTAVLRLVQMVAGGSLGEAAGYLGIAATDTTHERKGRIYSGAGHVHRIAKMHPDPYAFETALDALAGELDQPSTQLVNYQQRRRALEAWSIDADTWDDLIARLPAVPGPQEPELGDRKRQIASIYIWVQITSGEHHFAPRPIEAAQPAHIQHAGTPRVWWRLDSPQILLSGLGACAHDTPGTAHRRSCDFPIFRLLFYRTSVQLRCLDVCLIRPRCHARSLGGGPASPRRAAPALTAGSPAGSRVTL